MFKLLRKFHDTGAGAGGGAGESELLKKIKEQMSGSLKDFEKEKNIEGLRVALMDEQTGALAQLTAMANRIEKIETQGKEQPKDLSIRGQLKSWMDENKDELAKLKAGQKAELKPLQLRAVDSPMLPSNVIGSNKYITRFGVETGVNDYPRYARNVWESLKKGVTNLETIVWVNKKYKDGAAAFTAPGVAFPEASFTLETEFSNAKKIDVTEKCAVELLQDVDSFQTFVEEEIMNLIYDKLNEKVISSTSSSTNISGMKELGVAYTSTEIKTTDPQIMDCIRACVGVLRSGKLNGEITGYINPIDATNMDLAKSSSTGVYLIPPFTTADGKRIAGATLVEDSNVTVGSIIIGFTRYYKLDIYKGLEVKWGYENDDFTKGLTTCVGVLRLHQRFNTQYAGAFIADTFANIKTAITA